MANWDTTQTGAGVLDTAKGNASLFQDLAPVLAKIQPQVKTIAYTDPLFGEYQANYPSVLAKYGYSNPGSIDAWDVLATSVGLPVLAESQGVKWSWEFRPTTPFSTIADYQKGENWRVAGYKPSSGGGNILDFVWKDIAKFLNPISGGQAISERFSQSPTTVVENFAQSVINPPKLNPTQEAIQGGLNVIGSAGIGLGIEAFSTGVGGYTSATTPLPSGVQGPVNPGFWNTLLSGDLKGAWDILAAPISSTYHAPSESGLIGNTAKSLAMGDLVKQFVNLTGKVGTGILQLLTGDFAGLSRTFGTGNPSGTPTGASVNLFGNYQSGGGGGGAGLGVGSGGTGQTTTNPLVFPAIAVGVLAVLWLIMRKK